MTRMTSRPGARAPLATLPAITALANDIGARFRPRRVVLFGSYATGRQGPDSDVDLLVIMSTPLSPLQQAVRIAQSVEHRFPIDILVRTPQHITEALHHGDPFVRGVMATGMTLYAAPDSRLG